MRFKVEHSGPGRLRVSSNSPFGPAGRKVLRERLLALPGVTRVTVYKYGSGLVLEYRGSRAALLNALQRLEVLDLCQDPGDIGIAPEERELFDVFYEAALRRALTHTLLPPVVRAPVTLIKSLPFIPPALRALRQRRLTVEVLDATAIVVSQLMGDFSTASSIIFLLNLGEDLEGWVETRSRERLEGSLSFLSHSAWVITESGGLKETAIADVRVGDHVSVTSGRGIPLDGEVLRGRGMVNESTLTGEPLAVPKTVGDAVYASTVVENGELTLRVTSLATESRISQIVRLMTGGENFQSPRQRLNQTRADAVVAYNFLGAAITYALTRSVTRALLFLLVDISCVLKISTPIVVMTAMRQMGDQQVLIKGGRFVEEFAQADTFVFDKTGTLTTTRPLVMDVLTFGGFSREEVIRYAACLEEHYYHPIGHAVVEQADRENIPHDEMHGELTYIVSHGIQSEIDGKRTVIGSRHFVIEDEGVPITAEQEAVIAEQAQRYNLLYFSIDQQLAGVFCIDAPLRPNARQVMDTLRAQGKHLVMLTGDQQARAGELAAELGIEEVHSEVFPEDKHLFVQQQQRRGRRVVMVGDGINDSAALHAADIAVVMAESADLAQQVADVVILSNDLGALTELGHMSRGLERRLTGLYTGIIGVNGGLLALGLFNVLPGNLLALLHNASTIGFSLYSLGDLEVERFALPNEGESLPASEMRERPPEKGSSTA
ncbi:heavy metal translocating P-type ATPase [Deinococcus malanensis]|uniref:heavy metal translocating P-type ATPase n=2 Tax=Deinococcus malanensis TaxID=1706855 RepID=UPI0016684897|nr:heavy metal translocating P-type ATPase [Deinococcus malanensis]